MDVNLLGKGGLEERGRSADTKNPTSVSVFRCYT